MSKKLRKKLDYRQNVFPQHSPHKHLPIKHGVKGSQQLLDEPKIDHLLPTNKIKPMRFTVGTHHHCAKAIDNTMLPSLNEIATTQEKPTEHTKEECQQLQDYAATHLNVYVRYHTSGMILWVESDAAYLALPKAKRHIAGYCHLSNHPKRVTHPTINGATLVV